MCRNIRVLFNFEPPATDEEIREASKQFVRKVTGMVNTSGSNQKAIDKAVDNVDLTVHLLFKSLSTSAKPKNREQEAMKARQRSIKRFGVKTNGAN